MSTTDPRRGLGKAGEEMAKCALEAAGLTILGQNWRCRAGEIDIVAHEIGPDFVRGIAAVPWLVLVEVRTRRGAAYGTALQSITARKQRKMRQVAACYVHATGWSGPWRIDVVGVQMDANGKMVAIEHIRHAVSDS